MIDHSCFESLMQAVKRYFDLIYQSDVSQFDRVFLSTAQLHGFSRGEMRVLPAQSYKDNLAGAPSPRAQNAPREEEVLLVDFASPSQALVKVRVRANTIVYVDYLSYHRVDGNWLVTSNAFHVESRSDAIAAKQ